MLSQLSSLAILVWAPTLVLVVVLVVRLLVRGKFGLWCKQRWKVLLLIALCFLVAASTPQICIWVSLAERLPKDHVPGLSSGPDLIVNLLTISALGISAGFAYLSLPSDRAEMLLLVKTKDLLLAHGIEVESFIKWYDSLPPVQRTPSPKLVYGLLSPKQGIGGWTYLSDDDLHQALGKEVWSRFSQYVNQHIDDAIVRVCIAGLGLGMLMGLLCLFGRYFGLNKEFFSPVEFSVIMLLTLLIGVFGYFILTLAFGVHEGELAVGEGIDRCIRDQKPAINEWQDKSIKNLAQDFTARGRALTPTSPNSNKGKKG